MPRLHPALPARQGGGGWVNGQWLAQNVADPAESARIPRVGLGASFAVVSAAIHPGNHTPATAHVGDLVSEVPEPSRGRLWRSADDQVAPVGDSPLVEGVRCRAINHLVVPLPPTRKSTLQALTDGRYDPLAGEYRTRNGELKHYVATGHLAGERYATLIPDDLLDIAERGTIGWEGESETGVALHMVSALAAAGWIGLNAVGDTLEQARSLYAEVNAALDEAVQVGSDAPA
jgi:hypothetical protein